MRGLTAGYVIGRLTVFLLVVLTAASINFFIPRLAPGDPVGAMIARMESSGAQIEGSGEMIKEYRKMFGLDQPLPLQYVKFLGNLARLEFGFSLSYFPVEVGEIIRRSLRWTAGLLISATAIAFALGVGVGALLAWRGTPRMVRIFLPLSVIFAAIPYYLVAILLLSLFAYDLRLFPPYGAYDILVDPGLNLAFLASVARHAVLPGLSIVLASMGFWALGMRGLMVNITGEDYMLLAQAKGLTRMRIFWWYGVRNAIPPQVTGLTMALGSVVSGAILVEVLFAYPGMGYILFLAVGNSDYTLIQGITFVLVLSVASAVLVLDLLYPRLDPRVTYARR